MLKHAADLIGLLERIDQQRAEIERHYAAANLSYACRLAQRLAHDNPQLPRLAEEALDRERELWRWIAMGARELATAYRRLSLKEARRSSSASWMSRPRASPRSARPPTSRLRWLPRSASRYAWMPTAPWPTWPRRARNGTRRAPAAWPS